MMVVCMIEEKLSELFCAVLLCEFSTGCYLFTVSNSGLLYSHGRPPQSQQLPSCCFSHVTSNFDLWPWPTNFTEIRTRLTSMLNM